MPCLLLKLGGAWAVAWLLCVVCRPCCGAAGGGSSGAVCEGIGLARHFRFRVEGAAQLVPHLEQGGLAAVGRACRGWKCVKHRTGSRVLCCQRRERCRQQG